MASAGGITYDPNQQSNNSYYYYGYDKVNAVRFEWTSSQDIYNNSTTVNWNLKVLKITYTNTNGSGGYGYGGQPRAYTSTFIKLIIDGTSAYSNTWNPTNEQSNSEDEFIVVTSGSFTKQHADDGTSSFQVEIGCAKGRSGGYGSTNVKTTSQIFTLNTIYQSSDISSVSNIELGNNCSVKWTPRTLYYYYKLKFVLGQWSYTTDAIYPNTTSAYTYTGYTIPLTVANQLPNAASGSMSVYLYTYKEQACTTQLGSTSNKTFTISVPSSAIPTLSNTSITLYNTNAAINSWNVGVVGYTKVKLVTTAAGVYGSTFKNFVISGGYNATITTNPLNYTGDIITSSGSKSFSVQAKDSRNRSSAAASQTFTFYPYSNPTISSFAASRSQQSSTTVSAKVVFTFASVNNLNAATAQLYYRRLNTEIWTLYGAIYNNTDTTLVGVTFDERYSYELRIVVTDSVGNSVQEELTIPTISVLLDLKPGGNGFGIGKVAETDAMEVALPTIFFDSISIRVGNTTYTLADYIKQIVLSTELSQLSTNTGNISTIQGNISTIQGDISGINGDISSINGDISTINGDISSIEGDITTIQGDISDIKADIVDLKNGQ